METTPDYSEERVEVNGIDTAVFSAGVGTPLVFLPGGGTATGFDALLPLARRSRLIVPHHPGFGASADDASYDDFEDYVLHYIELLDLLGLDEVSLVGHSLGGLLAAKLAILQPRRVRRLVLVAPFGLDVAAHPTVPIFEIPDDEILGYLTSDASVMARLDPTAEFIADRVREMASLTRVLRARAFDPKLARWLHRLTMPTLLVWGDADRLVPSGQALSWAERIPGARTAILPGLGHLLFDESPAAVEAVGDFVAT
jgi:pimeloyl-ACP methyl ester carboxylesterase